MKENEVANEKKKVSFTPPEYTFHEDNGTKAKEKSGKTYAVFMCEFSFYLNNESDFTQESEFLGIYTDHKKAEKICHEYGYNEYTRWMPIKASDFVPWYDEHKLFHMLKGEYVFRFSTTHNYASLTIRHKVVIEIEPDIFTRLDLTYANFMDQDTYEKILDAFRRFRYDPKNNLSRFKNSIHKILDV